MSLPKPDTPIYTLILPSSGKKIKYRPWNGVEEKSLQIALMDDDKTTINNTMMSVINECTFKELDVAKLPDVDVDWCITQLRMKSVGEIVELTMPCSACDKEFDFNINLLEAEVIDNLKEARDKPIKIDNNIFFKMKLPSKEDYDAFASKDETETRELIAMMIDSIYTEDEVSNPKDYSFEEIYDYVKMFNKKTLKEVYKYVENIPKVIVKNVTTCRHCKTEHNILVEGTEFFFG